MRTRRTPEASFSCVWHHARNAAAFRSGYVVAWSCRNRSRDCRVPVSVSKRRPKARFKFTYRSKTGARRDENATFSFVIAGPPFHDAEIEELVRANPQSPSVDTSTCSPPYDVRGYHRLL